jgi:hypothetical protein
MSKGRLIAGLALSFALLTQIDCPAGIMDHWTTKQISTNSYGLEFLVHAENRYVAFGLYSDYGVALSSENGINWVVRIFGGPAVNQSPLSWSTALSHCGGKFFAFGGFGYSAVSPDGISWQTFQMDPVISGAAHNGSVFIAAVTTTFSTVPTSGFYESLDGANWFQLESQVISQLTSGGLGEIAFGASRFVAIGTGANAGHTYTSSTGTNWTQRSIPGGHIISFCNSLFIVPFGAGTNLVSTNGIDWAVLETGLPNEIGRANYDRGCFFAMAGPYLAASTNGTNWFQYSKPLPNFIRAIATDGTRLVGVGGHYTGTPWYDGFVYYTDPLVSLDITNTSPPQLVLSGLVGRNYRIEWTDSLVSGPVQNWQTAATLQLPSDPLLWMDPTAANSAHRYYRAVLLP